ncbi:polysaccharide pyruvyl transferase family protein [Shigella sp. FC1967]|uniref:polysaccharide pyruvyl transferase family protein n=1 Tax=Shigella sp. FC1967 TaxID=1898041 RepID=UPI0010081983
MVSLSSRTDCYTNKNNITDASPNDFIKLFSNASFVITTSFHGTVFSIINEVPFLTLKFNNDTDIRSESLLGQVNLLERHIESIADIDNLPLEFSFEESNLLLEKYRKKSNRFFKTSHSRLVNMKKILFVFHDSKPKSGATASMLDIINNLLKKN